MKIGDTVYLKDNLDVPMSIYKVDEGKKIHCCWFDEFYHLQRDYFHKDQLVINNNGEEEESENKEIALN